MKSCYAWYSREKSIIWSELIVWDGLWSDGYAHSRNLYCLDLVFSSGHEQGVIVAYHARSQEIQIKGGNTRVLGGRR